MRGVGKVQNEKASSKIWPDKINYNYGDVGSQISRPTKHALPLFTSLIAFFPNQEEQREGYRVRVESHPDDSIELNFLISNQNHYYRIWYGYGNQEK